MMAAPLDSSLSLECDNNASILKPLIYDSRNWNRMLAAAHVQSHGKINFSDNRSHQAEFIRIPPNASVMVVKEFLHKGLSDNATDPPKLVISITGGAKKYNMKPILLRAFRRGLLKVAQTTGIKKSYSLL